MVWQALGAVWVLVLERLSARSPPLPRALLWTGLRQSVRESWVPDLLSAEDIGLEAQGDRAVPSAWGELCRFSSGYPELGAPGLGV